MDLRLHPEPHDPLSCPSCSSSAFTLFSGTAKGLARVECIQCGHGFTLSVVEPEVIKVIHSINPVPSAYPARVIADALHPHTPYERGRFAFLHRQTLEDNPFHKGGISHLQWARGWAAAKAVHDEFPEGTHCHATRDDGDCNWAQCPQNRDGEPAATKRHCPLDVHDEEQ